MPKIRGINPTNDQDAIWRYFQNRQPEVFEGAAARMDYIIKKIYRKKGPSVPCILNIGAGNAYMERSVRQEGWSITSLDPDAGTVNWLLETGIRAQQGRIEKMPFKDEAFDFVVASEVLEHLNDEQLCEGLSETLRVLKRGGWFIGTVPYREELALNEVICPECQTVFHRWGHRRAFDLHTMHEHLSSVFGYAVVKRRAFVSFRDRNLVGKIKSLARRILASYGVQIAVPSIYFSARK